jgi:hypothetical protein
LFASDSLAPPAPVHAVAVRMSAARGEVAARIARRQSKVIYSIADAAQREWIEQTVREAMAKAQQARAQALLAVRLASAVRSDSGGTWSTVQFQIVEPEE